MPGPHLALLPLALLAGEFGQDVPPPPPATAAASSEPTQTVTLAEVADRYTVPVEIAGSGPYRFVIDTGAERTVISRQLAAMLNLPAGRRVNVVAMSGVSEVGTVVIPSLTLSSVPSIGAILAPALEAEHLGAAGLLGIDTLQHHKVTIDFDAKTMAVSPSEKRRKREKLAADEIVIRAKNVFGQLIVTDASIDGFPVRVVLDTGSPISIGNASLKRLALRHAARFQPLQLTSATGGIVDTQYTRASKLRVGGVEFVRAPIAFSDAPPFARFGLQKRPAMLLGMDTLRLFRRVDIDFPNREVRFRLPRLDRMNYSCLATINGACTS
jgi:predicted aspartyl protease